MSIDQNALDIVVRAAEIHFHAMKTSPQYTDGTTFGGQRRQYVEDLAGALEKVNSTRREEPKPVPVPVTNKVKKVDVISTAALLLGNDRGSVHPEYSRAIAELVNDLIGIGPADDLNAVEEMLWAIADD